MHDHSKAVSRSNVSGPVREVALPEGLASVQSIAIDAAGRIWIAEKVGRKLAAYDPDTRAFAVHTLPESWGNMGFSTITAGADAIWFTVNRWAEGSEEPRLIGRFTPSDGYFTKFALSTDTVPRELMVDARGAIWFLAANKNNLYRVDPKTFAMKGYPIPTANGHPRSLAADRAGRVWFVEANANRIAMFDPEKEVFAEHEVPTSFSNPGALSIDAQGRVWFVEVAANRIGMFSPERKRFDEVIVPTPSSAPVALVNDDSGRVWFLEYTGNKVGLFTPESAQLREYDIPTYGSLPAGMVLDRKRAMLWFTQSATEAKRLGTISIAEALQSPGSARRDLEPVAAAAQDDRFRGAGTIIAMVALISAAMIALGVWLTLRSRRTRKP